MCFYFIYFKIVTIALQCYVSFFCTKCMSIYIPPLNLSYHPYLTPGILTDMLYKASDIVKIGLETL